MRYSAFVITTVALVGFLGFSQSGVINEPLDDAVPVPYSIIDVVIKAILEKMRPKLANLKIQDINETIRNPGLNGSVLVNNILIQNLDKYEIKVLKSNLVPLKLTNLTLTWDNVLATANYDISAKVALSQTGNPINLFAKGNARAALQKIFFTIGANVEMKNNAIQVKPKGFFGFDLSIGKANVTLSSLMGSTDLAQAISTFVSNAIPELVNALKKPVFDAFHDDIVQIVNGILKNNGTLFQMDEDLDLPEFPQISLGDLDTSEEIEQPFDFSWGEFDSEPEF